MSGGTAAASQRASDQVELDASYDQVYYEPLIADVSKRLNSNSEAMRVRIGAPQRFAYGPT